MTREHTSDVPDRPSRKQYDHPRLITYGDITALTAAVGMTGAPDGGKGHNRTA